LELEVIYVATDLPGSPYVSYGLLTSYNTGIHDYTSVITSKTTFLKMTNPR